MKDSEYRPQYLEIIVTGIAVSFLIGAISVTASILLSEVLSLAPVILSLVSVFFGLLYVKGAKKNLGLGLILGALITVVFWTCLLVALSTGPLSKGSWH